MNLKTSFAALTLLGALAAGGPTAAQPAPGPAPTAGSQLSARPALAASSRSSAARSHASISCQ